MPTLRITGSGLLVAVQLMVSCVDALPTRKYFGADRDAAETIHAMRYAVAIEDWDFLSEIVVSDSGSGLAAGTVAFVERLDRLIASAESKAGVVRDHLKLEGDDRAVMELPSDGALLRVTLGKRRRGDIDIWMVLWDATGVYSEPDGSGTPVPQL